MFWFQIKLLVFVRMFRFETYRSVSLSLIPGKVMEQILSKAISKHVKNKEVKSSDYGFMKRN